MQFIDCSCMHVFEGLFLVFRLHCVTFPKVEERRKVDAAEGHEIAKLLEGKINRKVNQSLQIY